MRIEDIPERLRRFNFVLVGKDKVPTQYGWQKKFMKYDNSELKEHISKGFNYGVQGNNSFIEIDGEQRFLVMIDFDKRELQDKILKEFPETFTTTSGSSKKCLHIWLASDNNKSFSIHDKELNTLADIQARGKQLIAPGSTHPSGSKYSVVKDLPFAYMPYAEIEAIIRPHDEKALKKKKPMKPFIPKGDGNDIGEKVYNAVSMEDVLRELNIDTSKNPTDCYFHSSKGGKCFSWTDEVCNCFHCDGSWNKFSLIREAMDLPSKETYDWFAEKSGLTEELKQARKNFKKEIPMKFNDIQNFSKRGQIENFWNVQPFFYDKSKIFWLWDKDNFKWDISDEVDFCNSIYNKLGVNTINSKERGETIEAFKQVGRMHQPKAVSKGWVQFKDKIYDIKNNNEFEATPEYFIKNPIPWKIGKSEDTPTLDKLFLEWVGEDYKPTLEEIGAYAVIPDRFMQRIIALVGGGSNGKGSYQKFIYKFLGSDNCVTSEIKQLSENQFEPSVLYGRLLVVFGEVSYNDLTNTNQVKKIAGEDKMSFQFKGKNPFTDDNTALGMCLTNSLPTTPDKSMGFYRKWLIVDFPNQFKEIKKDLIGEIPEVEFENFSKKCLRILKELYENPAFTNEGDFEERAKRYEERSNPVMRFIEEECLEEPGLVIPLREFTNACNEYLREKHLRTMNSKQISKALREEGFIVGNRKIDGNSVYVIVNLGVKKCNYPPNPPNPRKTTLIPYIEPTSNYKGNKGNKGITQESPNDINPFEVLNLEKDLNEVENE